MCSARRAGSGSAGRSKSDANAGSTRATGQTICRGRQLFAIQFWTSTTADRSSAGHEARTLAAADARVAWGQAAEQGGGQEGVWQGLLQESGDPERDLLRVEQRQQRMPVPMPQRPGPHLRVVLGPAQGDRSGMQGQAEQLGAEWAEVQEVTTPGRSRSTESKAGRSERPGCNTARSREWSRPEGRSNPGLYRVRPQRRRRGRAPPWQCPGGQSCVRVGANCSQHQSGCSCARVGNRPGGQGSRKRGSSGANDPCRKKACGAGAQSGGPQAACGSAGGRGQAHEGQAQEPTTSTGENTGGLRRALRGHRGSHHANKGKKVWK